MYWTPRVIMWSTSSTRHILQPNLCWFWNFVVHVIYKKCRSLELVGSTLFEYKKGKWSRVHQVCYPLQSTNQKEIKAIILCYFQTPWKPCLVQNIYQVCSTQHCHYKQSLTIRKFELNLTNLWKCFDSTMILYVW